MALGKRTKEARIEAGLTQGQLAEAIGKNQTYIQSLESRDSKKTESSADIARVLNVWHDWLVTGEGKKKKDFTNNLQSGSSNELALAVDSQSPVNLKGSLSVETAIILIRIIHEGLGFETFNSMTEDAQKQVVRVIATWDFTGNRDDSQLVDIIKALHSN